MTSVFVYCVWWLSVCASAFCVACLGLCAVSLCCGLGMVGLVVIVLCLLL